MSLCSHISKAESIRFAKLEKEEEIERMLAEIKQRRGTA